MGSPEPEAKQQIFTDEAEEPIILEAKQQQQQPFSYESEQIFSVEAKQSPPITDEEEQPILYGAEQTFSVMEPILFDDNNVITDGLTIETASRISDGENHIAVLEKTLSPSSSSSSTSSGSPFELDVTSSIRLAQIQNDYSLAHSDTQLLASDENGYEKHESQPSNGSSPTQSPPHQMVMEPPSESSVPSGYRIPSSVFAKSSAPAAEWSTCSNESLFSIHMGNMSFTREHVNWYKSGELGLIGEPMTPPGMELSGNQFLSNQPPPKSEAHITESKAAETMREVIKENEAGNANKEKSFAKVVRTNSASFRDSDASGASVTSFAFPILTGDHKGDMTSPKQHLLAQPQTPKVAREQEHPELNSKIETDNNTIFSRWISCFPCCTSCS